MVERAKAPAFTHSYDLKSMNAANSLDRLNGSSEERRLPGLIDALRVGEFLSSGPAAPFDEPRESEV
jgi:hypothetical protein